MPSRFGLPMMDLSVAGLLKICFSHQKVLFGSVINDWIDDEEDF